MPRLGRTLAARILLAVLGIVVVTLAVGFALFARLTSQTADAQAIEQASGIAVTLGRGAAGRPARSWTATRPSVLPALGSQVRASTGASYVVIIDRTGLRYSHPNPALIGQRIEEPVVALDGQVHTGIDEGSLGRSANARAPIVDAAGAASGEVSVGILESEVGVRLDAEVLDIALYAGDRPRPRGGGVAAAGPRHQTGDLRGRAGRDRRARAGARGDAARHTRRACWPSTPRARSTCSTTRRGACSASSRPAWASGSRTSCPTAGCAASSPARSRAPTSSR